MALPAFDAFTRANAATLGANWTDQNAGMSISGNKAVPTGGSFSQAYWNADVFGNDQYAQAVLGELTFVTSAQYVGLLVRANGGAGSNNGYILYADSTDLFLGKYVAGAFSAIVTFSGQSTIGATYRLEVQGTTLRAYKNGVQMGSDQADGAVSAGSGGVLGFNSGEARLDDWEGGNLGGAAFMFRRNAVIGQAVNRASTF
jgi:hypothetical protein